MRTLGIEIEYFITNKDGQIVPEIDRLLPELRKKAKNINQFGFELFAGQIESRTSGRSSDGCCSVNELINSLLENEKLLIETCEELELKFICTEYVPEKELGELAVNSFDERHKEIWEKIPKERKVAASQVAAIHVHIETTEEEAVKVLNFCRKDVIDKLVEIGDFSKGKRINAYRKMAKTYGDPPIFKDFEELKAYIQKHGGERDVWDLVRYKALTGTVEFRMFGATSDMKKVEEFVESCKKVVKSANENGRP